MSGIKHDSEKPDFSLISSIAEQEVAKVMTYGKKKYSANNWRGGIAYSRLYAAARRHMSAWNGGESTDPETGLSHLAHASCCLMMLLEFEVTRPDLDDRYKSESVLRRFFAEKCDDVNSCETFDGKKCCILNGVQTLNEINERVNESAKRATE